MRHSGLLMLSMIFLIILPETDVFLGVLIPGARAYSASVLAVLNSRTSLSERFRHKNDIGTFGLVGYISSRISGEDITSAGPDETQVHRNSAKHIPRRSLECHEERSQGAEGNPSVTNVYECC
ncbi:hypothetical protein BD311DRAFT_759227 [Dichomitus squalens]|uniref:Secreted protein n=1 Tax=Dichomitus squalens TaxID=114155 RepID=A0A4Q9MKA9_9APHY|nr:hypothetical protein BD311DRAFT_759227 [Dichomitus squalens]